jgi:hypothetical protein
MATFTMLSQTNVNYGPQISRYYTEQTAMPLNEDRGRET